MMLLRFFLAGLFSPLAIFAQGPEPARPDFKTEQANPGAPVPDPAAAMKRMKKVSEDEFELGQIRFNAKTREVRLPCVLNMREGAIEYAVVHETGKTHEALLKSTASPLDLQVAMLLTSYQPGHSGLFPGEKDEAIRKRMESTAPKTPGANNVQLFVEWKDDAETKKLRLTDWMLEAPQKKPPTDFKHWVFNGSMIQASGFSAEIYGSLIGIYYDVTAVINCPSRLNGADDVWSPNTKLMPKEETPVTVIITPVAP